MHLNLLQYCTLNYQRLICWHFISNFDCLDSCTSTSYNMQLTSSTMQQSMYIWFPITLNILALRSIYVGTTVSQIWKLLCTLSHLVHNCGPEMDHRPRKWREKIVWTMYCHCWVGKGVAEHWKFAFKVLQYDVLYVLCIKVTFFFSSPSSCFIQQQLLYDLCVLWQHRYYKYWLHWKGNFTIQNWKFVVINFVFLFEIFKIVLIAANQIYFYKLNSKNWKIWPHMHTAKFSCLHIRSQWPLYFFYLFVLVPSLKTLAKKKIWN